MSDAIDFRSDFVARPTEEMIEAMVNAAKLPSGFGLRENRIVSELELLAAKIVDKEDALFVPTCMMANQIAIALRCAAGDRFITEKSAHVITSEMDAAHMLTGAVSVEVPAVNGSLELDAVDENCASLSKIEKKPKLIVIENSHVRSGGRVVSLEHMESLFELSQKYDVSIHLDGARVFNAADAIGCTVSEIASFSDTVAFNLNKGLGAPLGAILAGPRPLIERAVKVRQLLGGGWRPAGIPAAAGIIALKTMTERLAVDRQHAKKLAMGISRINGIEVSVKNTETNIVLSRPLKITPSDLVDRLSKREVLVLAMDQQVRWVTHYEITESAINTALGELQEILRGG